MQLVELVDRDGLEVFTVPSSVTAAVEQAKREARKLAKKGTAAARREGRALVKKAKKRAAREAKKLGKKAGREFKKQVGPGLTAVGVVAGLASVVFIVDVIRRWR